MNPSSGRPARSHRASSILRTLSVSGSVRRAARVLPFTASTGQQRTWATIVEERRSSGSLLMLNSWYKSVLPSACFCDVRHAIFQDDLEGTSRDDGQQSR
jgi:hypothetical protein